MIYIFETEIPNEKSLLISLSEIYGIGKYQASFICKNLGFCKNLKASELSQEQIFQLIRTIEKSDLILTSELKKLQAFSLRNLVEIKSYRGLRRLKGLPVRGQRTHTNSRTSRRRRHS